jgi:hypothetical protein
VAGVADLCGQVGNVEADNALAFGSDLEGAELAVLADTEYRLGRGIDPVPGDVLEAGRAVLDTDQFGTDPVAVEVLDNPLGRSQGVEAPDQ